MSEHVYKVGHCPGCSAQTLIVDTFNRPIGFMKDTFACWLCLCDEEFNVKTRIGSFVLCKHCFEKPMDAEKVWSNLVSSPYSGLMNLEIPELKLFPYKKIEMIKHYGV